MTVAILARYTRSDMDGEHDHGSTSQKFLTQLAAFTNGTEDPDWKVKVLKRQSATGAFDRLRLKSSSISASYFYSGKPSNGRFSYKGYCVNRHNIDFTNYYGEIPSDLTLRDQALARLKRKINDHNKNFSLLVPLAEIGELRGSLKAAAYATIDMLKALIDIKRTKGKSAYQYAAHAWLTWSFGIKPTLNDVSDLLESIDAFIMRQNTAALRETGSARKTYNLPTYRIGTNLGYGVVSGITVGALGDLSYRFTAGFVPQLQAGNNYGAAAHLGLGIPELVPVAWELTAFSWVFDYFSTMGAFLEDVFTSRSTSTIYVCEGKKYVVVGSATIDPPQAAQDHTVWGDFHSQQQKFELHYVSRTPLNAIPLRQLRFKTPKEITGLSGELGDFNQVDKAISRVLNLASVLVGGKAFSNHIT